MILSGSIVMKTKDMETGELMNALFMKVYQCM